MVPGIRKLMVKKERICKDNLELPRHLQKNVFTLQLLAHFLVCRTEHRQLMPLCCLHLSVLRGHHQTCTILSLAHATERSNVNKTSHQQILHVNLGNKNGTAYTRTRTQHSTHPRARTHTQHTAQHSTAQHSTAHTHTHAVMSDPNHWWENLQMSRACSL
jgi:hypothetical protein